MRKGVDHIGVAVAYFCHDGKGLFLLSKRSQNTRDEQGRWECGGGGVKLYETIEEAVRREIKEELGVNVLLHEYLGHRDVHREHEGTKTHWILFDFKVFIDPKEVTIGEPDMIAEIGWFRLDELPQPLHSQMPSTVEKYRERLSRKTSNDQP